MKMNKKQRYNHTGNNRFPNFLDPHIFFAQDRKLTTLIIKNILQLDRNVLYGPLLNL